MDVNPYGIGDKGINSANKFLKRGYFRFWKCLGSKKKKRKQKKLKRPGTIRNFGNEKTVSTISALWGRFYLIFY